MPLLTFTVCDLDTSLEKGKLLFSLMGKVSPCQELRWGQGWRRLERSDATLHNEGVRRHQWLALNQKFCQREEEKKKNNQNSLISVS